jgi:hypothetical protein
LEVIKAIKANVPAGIEHVSHRMASRPRLFRKTPGFPTRRS